MLKDKSYITRNDSKKNNKNESRFQRILFTKLKNGKVKKEDRIRLVTFEQCCREICKLNNIKRSI